MVDCTHLERRATNGKAAHETSAVPGKSAGALALPPLAACPLLLICHKALTNGHETHFVAAGGQVKSMTSWLAFMFFGSSRERILGIKLPPPNLQPGYEEQAKRFIDSVADRVFAAAS